MSHLLLTTVTRSPWFGIRENFVTSRHFGVNPEVKPNFKTSTGKQKPVYLVDLKIYPGRIEFGLFARKYSRCDRSTDW